MQEVNVTAVEHTRAAIKEVPPGGYHGWRSLENETQMISVAGEVYKRARPDAVRISPDTFGDVWSVKGR
jgi:dTDP-4-dehydrorhamnose 3,5-epimerase-like enzyme